jgi:hypothetical protein
MTPVCDYMTCVVPSVTARVQCLRGRRVYAYSVCSMIAAQVADLDFVPFWPVGAAVKAISSAPSQYCTAMLP